MVPPTFAGYPMFGVSIKMKAGMINPPARQENDYPGVNGLEDLEMGMRGAVSVVTGRHVGSGESDLNAQQMLVRAFYGAGAFTLTDGFGNAWPRVKLESFSQTGDVQVSLDGRVSQTYEARFRHLLVPAF